MGAFFAPAESSWGYFHLFCEIFKQHGVPQSIYTDCHSVFWTDREPTLEEQLINRKPTTEVGRGLEELGVTLILAHSPQAKGRIERLWNTFQDRLVSELRLAKAKTVEQATVVLNRYLIVHNRRFAQLAKAEPAWRKLSALKIERALCFKQQRTVAKDNTVTFEGSACRSLRPRPFAPCQQENRCACASRWRGGVFLQHRENRNLRFKNNAHNWPISNERYEGGVRYGPLSKLATLPQVSP